MLRLPSFAFHGNYSAGQGNQTWLINLTLMIPPLQRREHMSGTFPGTAPIRIYITVQRGNYPHLTARKVDRKWRWNAQWSNPCSPKDFSQESLYFCSRANCTNSQRQPAEDQGQAALGVFLKLWKVLSMKISASRALKYLCYRKVRQLGGGVEGKEVMHSVTGWPMRPH